MYLKCCATTCLSSSSSLSHNLREFFFLSNLPPVHHPLDAPYDSVVDETQLVNFGTRTQQILSTHHPSFIVRCWVLISLWPGRALKLAREVGGSFCPRTGVRECDLRQIFLEVATTSFSVLVERHVFLLPFRAMAIANVIQFW